MSWTFHLTCQHGSQNPKTEFVLRKFQTENNRHYYYYSHKNISPFLTGSNPPPNQFFFTSWRWQIWKTFALSVTITSMVQAIARKRDGKRQALRTRLRQLSCFERSEENGGKFHMLCKTLFSVSFSVSCAYTVEWDARARWTPHARKLVRATLKKFFKRVNLYLENISVEIFRVCYLKS